MDEWLCKRLTPAKQKLGKWTGLSHVYEKLWETWPMPELERYQNLRDSFLALDEDLAKQIAQMGDYFSYELPNEESRAISLAWRRLELQYKDLELILRSLFRRHFGLIEAEWWPIFAPVDQVYGTKYITSDGFADPSTKNVPPDGYFLTSRGYLAANIASMSQLGLDRANFYSVAYPLVVRTKPIDRIFMGFLYYIYHEVDFEVWTDFWREIHRRDYKLDFAADGEDALSEIARREHATNYVAGMGTLDARTFWRLDWHLPLDVMGRYENDLPLDTVIPGVEGLESFLWDIRTINRRIDVEPGFFPDEDLTAATVNERIINVDGMPNVASAFDENAETKRTLLTPWQLTPWHCDMYLPLNVAGHYENDLPLDTEIPGYEGLESNLWDLRSNSRTFTIDCHVDSEYSADSDALSGKTMYFATNHMDKAARYDVSVRQLAPADWGNPHFSCDKFACFDDCPADFAMCDLPIGGYYE